LSCWERRKRICIQECVTRVVTAISGWHRRELLISKGWSGSTPHGRGKGTAAYQDLMIYFRIKKHVGNLTPAKKDGHS